MNSTINNTFTITIITITTTTTTITTIIIITITLQFVRSFPLLFCDEAVDEGTTRHLTNCFGMAAGVLTSPGQDVVCSQWVQPQNSSSSQAQG